MAMRKVEMAYFIDEDYQGNRYATDALIILSEWCFKVSEIPYLILTIDCANEASCRVAVKAGFEKFEKRTPLSHKQPNMESDSYYYFRIIGNANFEIIIYCELLIIYILDSNLAFVEQEM